MSICGYIRISTIAQNIDNQKLAILDYANKKDFTINSWVESKCSSKKSAKIRYIDKLLLSLNRNDILIVAELSRLGRSVREIIILLDELLKKKITVICIKENLEIKTKHNIQSKIMITMISLFAEIERDLISERTKEGLARAKAEGKLLGRPKGKLGKSRLDGKEKEIQSYINKGVNISNIARIYEISNPALKNFIKTRELRLYKSIELELQLEVENNSKFVRQKKKAREEIELLVLSSYSMIKLDKEGYRYKLILPYENDKQLDYAVSSILEKMDLMADSRNCFIEADIYSEKLDKSW